jgi:hypothetical protein
VHYATAGATLSTQVATFSSTNHRVLNGFNGQLYLSNNSTTVGIRGVNTVGTGFPTTVGQAIAQLAGFSDTDTPTPALMVADDYWFKDATTLYIADGRTDGINGGVQKWVFDDSDGDTILEWEHKYTATLGNSIGTPANFVGGHGLAGTLNELGQAVLYATTFDSAGAGANKLVRLIDDGTSLGFAGSVTTLAQSPLNGTFATAFRGVEFIPIPEPAAATALGLATIALLRRRRQA